MTLMPAGKNCNLGWAWWHTPEILALVEERQVELCEICQLQVSTDDHWLAESSCWLEKPLSIMSQVLYSPFLARVSPTISVGCCLYDSCQPFPASAPRFPLAHTSSFIKTVQAIKWKLTQLAFTTTPNMAASIPIEQMPSLLKYRSVRSSCTCSSHFLLD